MKFVSLSEDMIDTACLPLEMERDVHTEHGITNA